MLKARRYGALAVVLAILLCLAACGGPAAAGPAPPTARPDAYVRPDMAASSHAGEAPVASSEAEPATAEPPASSSAPTFPSAGELPEAYRNNPLVEIILLNAYSGAPFSYVGVLLPLTGPVSLYDNEVVTDFMDFMDAYGADFGFSWSYYDTLSDTAQERAAMEMLVTVGCDLFIVVNPVNEVELLAELAAMAEAEMYTMYI